MVGHANKGDKKCFKLRGLVGRGANFEVGDKVSNLGIFTDFPERWCGDSWWRVGGDWVEARQGHPGHSVCHQPSDEPAAAVLPTNIILHQWGSTESVRTFYKRHRSIFENWIFDSVKPFKTLQWKILKLREETLCIQHLRYLSAEEFFIQV